MPLTEGLASPQRHRVEAVPCCRTKPSDCRAMSQREVRRRCLERLRQVIRVEGGKVLDSLEVLRQEEDADHLVDRRGQLLEQLLDLWT